MYEDVFRLVQLVAIIGGWIWVVARIGARIESLTAAIDRLTSVLDSHDERIRRLEMGHGHAGHGPRMVE